MCHRPCSDVSIVVDGYYGSGTAATFEKVQTIARITPDGEYGPATRVNMLWPVHTVPDGGRNGVYSRER